MPHDDRYEFTEDEFATLFREARKHIEILLEKGITQEGFQKVVSALEERHPGVRLIGLRDAGDKMHTTWENPDGDSEADVEGTIRENWKQQYELASQRANLLQEELNHSRGLQLLLAENPRNLERKMNNNFNAPVGNFVGGDAVGSNLTSSIQQLAQSPSAEVREFAERLAQLEQSIAASPELDAEAKKRAQAKLAEAAKPDESGRSALESLKGMVFRIPDLLKSVEAAEKIWEKASQVL